MLVPIPPAFAALMADPTEYAEAVDRYTVLLAKAYPARHRSILARGDARCAIRRLRQLRTLGQAS